MGQDLSPTASAYGQGFRNDGRLKLLIMVGTRPEIIRLSAVIDACRRVFDTLLVHTGQNYDYNLNGIFFRDLQIAEPEICLDAAGAHPGETIGNVIHRAYELMAHLRPDAFLILGDTNSCLAAVSAKRLHIPIFHMEAGNRCGDERLPEEINRRMVDVISDVNLAYSEQAGRNLRAAGLPSERIFVIGSPMAEVLRRNLAQIVQSTVHRRLGLEKGGYMLLSAHREENVDDENTFRALLGAVNAAAEKWDMPILYSCHPHARKRLEAAGISLDRRVRLHEPLGFHDYNCLQMNAFCVLSDSGTLPEESSFFRSVGHPFPAVSLRTSTERPEAMEQGCFLLAGTEEKTLLQAIETARRLHESGAFGRSVAAYRDERVSQKVVRIIQSYTAVIKNALT